MAGKFKKIIAATDFSQPSEAAVEYAMEIAGPGSIVVICHVVDDVPLTYGYVGVSAPTPEIRTRMAEGAAAELGRVLPKNPPAGVEVEGKVLHGSPFLEIIKLAKSEAADLIVVGTHGRTGLKHMLIGSVAERVVRKAPCPVLVVRGDEGPEFELP